ncbi:hypothetical protein [Nostoc sp.]|uniref:hypothetical protein n=1 Tax=Nostoc sp. TaxID=1180 RepID=UPI002FFC4667
MKDRRCLRWSLSQAVGAASGREVRATPKQYYKINKKRSLFSYESLQDINIES